mmetsp:Transcript_30630/g.39285  ORF Transcript_30630/g.39285 Transcript_30630/m.39285 type:complete len:205 (+) Transcript_30630:302-916(+)
MRIQKRYGDLSIFAGTTPPPNSRVQGYKKSKKKKKKKGSKSRSIYNHSIFRNATPHEQANIVLQNVENMDSRIKQKFYKNMLAQPGQFQVTPRKYKPRVGFNSRTTRLNAERLRNELEDALVYLGRQEDNLAQSQAMFFQQYSIGQLTENQYLDKLKQIRSRMNHIADHKQQVQNSLGNVIRNNQMVVITPEGGSPLLNSHIRF